MFPFTKLRYFHSNSLLLQRKTIKTYRRYPISFPSSVTSPSQIPSSFIDLTHPQLSASVKRIKATLYSLLKTRLSKHMVLANPHPGCVYLNQDLVASVSGEIDAHFVSLEYKDILDLVSNHFPFKRNTENDTLYLQTPFSPSMFYPSQDFYQEPTSNKEEEINEEDDQDDFQPPNYVIKNEFLKQFHNGRKIVRTKVNSKSNEISTIEDDSKLNTTHYNESITNEQLKRFEIGFFNYLLEMSKTKQRLVLFIKDTSDIIDKSKSGKEICWAIMNATLKAKNYFDSQEKKNKNYVALVFNFTPSLLEKDNLNKTIEFYKEMASPDFSFSDRNGSIYTNNLWKSPTFNLFSTSIDSMKRLFVKIDIPPIESSPAPGLDMLERQEDSFDYLISMEQDMKFRIREINWKNLISMIQSRNILINNHELVLDRFIDRTQFHPGFDKSLEYLDREILTYNDIDNVIDLAIGCKLSSVMEPKNGRVVGKYSAITTLSLTHISKALKLSLDTDPKSMSPIQDHEPKPIPSPISENVTEKAVVKVTPPKPSVESVKESKTAVKLASLQKKLSTYEKKLVGTVVDPELINVDFNDLVLPAQTKMALQTVVTLPLMYPELFSTGILRKYSINGVLLFGPPGTGKTMLAKALAKSGGARFMKIALSDIFDKYVGEGEKNVKAIFTLARKLSPCVVFLDEVDAVFGARRGDSSNGSRREVINEFMSEWDGLTSNNEGIVVLGATNRPFDLDDAILRRMPRRILVDLPTQEQRLHILQSHLKGDTIEDQVDLSLIAEKTVNYSGSDLKNVCVSASVASIKNILPSGSILPNLEDLKKGGILPDKILTQEHFDIALKEIPPSLTDEMQTLIELRKWNETYGEGANDGKPKKKGWGFNEPV